MVTVKGDVPGQVRTVQCQCRRTLEYRHEDVKSKEGPVVWDPTYIYYIECPICYREVEVPSWIFV
jgi:hypothetical protein